MHTAVFVAAEVHSTRLQCVQVVQAAAAAVAQLALVQAPKPKRTDVQWVILQAAQRV